ncbi:hypothetical protein FS837_005594, partial [Tulasnella sp. UAMH 9824]
IGSAFEGGCAIVSRALLSFSSNGAKYQVLESRTGTLMASKRASTSEGANECGEKEASEDEGKGKRNCATRGQEHEDTAETSGERK